MKKMMIGSLVGCALAACGGQSESNTEMNARSNGSGGESESQGASQEQPRMAGVAELGIDIGGPNSISASSGTGQSLVVTLTNETQESLRVTPAVARVAVMRDAEVVEGCEGEAKEVSLEEILRPSGSTMVGLDIPCNLEEPGAYSVQVEIAVGESEPMNLSVADTRFAETMDLEVVEGETSGEDVSPGLADPSGTAVEEPRAEIEGVEPVDFADDEAELSLVEVVADSE